MKIFKNLINAWKKLRSFVRIWKMVPPDVESVIVDNLTGLHKREVFLHLVDRMDNSVERTMIFFDLNGLKEVNDTFGHDAGDGYIAAFAEAVKKVIRRTDLSCRWGGDEFIVVIDGDEISAEMVVSRISKLTKVSFAYGISKYGTSFIEALNEADSKMYANKRENQ